MTQLFGIDKEKLPKNAYPNWADFYDSLVPIETDKKVFGCKYYIKEPHEECSNCSHPFGCHNLRGCRACPCNVLYVTEELEKKEVCCYSESCVKARKEYGIDLSVQVLQEHKHYREALESLRYNLSLFADGSITVRVMKEIVRTALAGTDIDVGIKSKDALKEVLSFVKTFNESPGGGPLDRAVDDAVQFLKKSL